MTVFRLEPNRTKLDDPRWGVSVIRETIWVDAGSENEARDMAAQQSVLMSPTRRYEKKEMSPWYDFSLTSCCPDKANNNILEHGVVVRADGDPINKL
ncbi:MAG: hypothetical protein KGJ49_07140 [Alphaproteobacteria bacterium]|nr:hypothetical protein [Alphaproteobacteria bacterium]